MASVDHPTVQATAGTVATATKMVAGGIQGAAGAVAANDQGNDLKIPQTAVTGVARRLGRLCQGSRR